jgi:uncharacterized protein YkvS
MQNNPHNFKKFKKMPFLFSILLLIFSCTVFFFLYKQINDNKKIAEKEQIEWQNETDRRNEIKSLERLIKEIDQERVLVESHFAQSSNIVPFLDTIEGLASKVNAISEVVSVDIIEDTSQLLVVIKTLGSFESIYKFLKLLENSPYEIEFASVDIQKSNTQTWEAIFKIKLLSFVQ